MTPACSMRSNPTWRFGLTECPRGIDRHIGVEPLAYGSHGRKGRADFERYTSEDQLLAAGPHDGASHALVVEGVDRRAIDDLDAWQRLHEFGERWPPHTVARRRGNDDRQLQCLGSFGQGHHVVFQLTGRIITDAGHEADLMINENDRRIFGGEGLAGPDLFSHYILIFTSCGVLSSTSSDL